MIIVIVTLATYSYCVYGRTANMQVKLSVGTLLLLVAHTFSNSHSHQFYVAYGLGKLLACVSKLVCLT